MYRVRFLGIQLPVDAPTFDNRILTRGIKGVGRRVASKANEGVRLCWDSSVIPGACVLTTREDGTPVVAAVSAPTPGHKSEPQ